MYASPEGKKVIDKILSDNNLSYDKYLQIMNSVSSNKKGGTLRRKYLEGGKAAEYAKQIKEGISADNASKMPKGMDPKVWEAQNTLMSDGENVNLTPADYTRMAGLAQDIIALGASFGVGAGSLVAGGLGVTSALTDMAADIMDDGVSGWDVAKNLVTNLGLAAFGALLGGKIGSIGAKLAKLGPKLVTYVALGAGSFAA
jgi:hypothetical protein